MLFSDFASFLDGESVFAGLPFSDESDFAVLSAAEAVLAVLSDDSLAALGRLSLMYQPDPLNTTPTG